MKIALVSGDGLPASGLLTVFRSVLGLLGDRVDYPVPADLGYSWRPDKPAYFPAGPADPVTPDWLLVSSEVPVPDSEAELLAIRDAVARAATLSEHARTLLRQRIEALAAPYERYFRAWLDRHRPDWVVAVNLTLSDAVPVTLALHRAIAASRANLLCWDHDLFGSCAVFEHGERVYPLRPNEFTPLPGPEHRWAVVSGALADEAEGYGTGTRPVVVPNVLPQIPSTVDKLHHDFRTAHELAPDRPVLLAPVRVFRVKGVELSVRLFAQVREAARRRGEPEPYLLVFGALDEDPDYARTVLTEVRATGTGADIRFLNGVPLGSGYVGGTPRLAETDLLALADAVLFTPSRPDVETIGLGPALAAAAGIPCAVTPYDAYHEVYGPDFHAVHVGQEGAPDRLLDLLAARRSGAAWYTEQVAANRELVARVFPEQPWRALLASL
ncbi:hypothetical protein JOF53_007580 [Crossiella equi]|uniref:Glycosyl transferases group 1 n=1 Tax=Crossiella equi TaxID=130796 RepID=A0ABS5AQ61_9PSEU|nr:hypothetical protein [Crossiella equi]MBP2478708.1 hypothetical protein [Crossiella equi]